MSVHAHLQEAHKRLLRAAVGLLIGAIIGYVLSDQVLAVLRAPIEVLAESRNASLNYDSVSAAFDLKVKIALFAGVAVSSPVWLYQVFAFFLPGLTRREKQYTFGFFLAAVPLFIAGCTTGFLLFPHIVELLAGFGSTEDSTVLVASYYFDFVMKLVLAVGVSFVLPVFVVLLNFIGILPGTTIVRSWRFVIVGILVFSALATPSADVMSMFLLAVPMTGLFALAAAVAVLHDHRTAQRTSNSEGRGNAGGTGSNKGTGGESISGHPPRDLINS
ncbi:twin-arginine translocase subunit TatC [Arthrobacter agilis]|uniref:Sec-independent protein translocase protein TatC n=1 Tax=Arthrobacter agilis TaxID=37921 RepID=A0A2L0UH84_9MICC|nr:twin-arginine translocase subunit TatC [Arthrobacter agilis]AUZ88587.1 twin-arginine translocase subunit TatC [Arthrobacter agilis]